mmetsp:Transcript_98173/g.311403  ORF Transcript_98173/g.311403 Transcript_98173/m.311403 type:complete len:449 (-) Transcript_98173:189-1535(-)
MAQLHCGKSQSCGAKGTKQACSSTNAERSPATASTSSVWPASCSPAQPPSTTARRPVRCRAPRASLSIWPGGRPLAIMEPQPTTTGAGPAARKRRRAAKHPGPSSSRGGDSSARAQAAVRCRRRAFGSGSGSRIELTAKNCGREGSTSSWSSKSSRVSRCSHTGIAGTHSSCSWRRAGPPAALPAITACGWNSFRASSTATQTPGFALSQARQAALKSPRESKKVPPTPPMLRIVARVSAKTGTASMPRSALRPTRFAVVKARTVWWCTSLKFSPRAKRGTRSPSDPLARMAIRRPPKRGLAGALELRLWAGRGSPELGDGSGGDGGGLCGEAAPSPYPPSALGSSSELFLDSGSGADRLCGSGGRSSKSKYVSSEAWRSKPASALPTASSAPPSSSRLRWRSASASVVRPRFAGVTGSAAAPRDANSAPQELILRSAGRHSSRSKLP